MSSSQPLVSVLMTAYNRQSYIAHAIESVLASTYKNWELIIVDDGSKDNTVSIAQAYAAQDQRIRIYINEKNLGDYPNRNKAASYAQGTYLKYLDSDDYLYPWGLELLVRMMQQFPEAGWGLCSLIQVMPDPYPFILMPKEAYKHHYLGPGLFHKAPLSSIIKKYAFEKAGGFESLRMVGDFEMWHRLALFFPVVLMPDGIVWYREHSGQEVTEYRSYLLKYEKITHQYLLHSECPLSLGEKQLIISKRKKALLKELFFEMLKLKFSNTLSTFKLLRLNQKLNFK